MLRLLSVVVLALTLALVTDASVVRRDAAPITLPFVKRVNTTGTAKLLEIDQARAKALREHSEGHRRPPTTVPATNVAVTYVTTVSVGDPPQNFSLLVDTGSANTWVGAGTPYDTSNAHDTSEQVFVAYGSGFFVGEEYDDTVTLGQCLGIKNQSLGAAVYSEGFDGYDGILGIGPTDLTCGTLLDSDDCIPTVIDNAFSQDLIPCKQVGISYEPTTSVSDPNGELTLGGINKHKFTGPLQFVPITSASPASYYVGIDQTVTYGHSHKLILDTTAGIVDTGTTLIMLATDAYNTYQNATGATVDDNTGLLKITNDQYANLKSLFFEIGDTKYELVANAQIWPRALNTAIGGQPDDILLIVGDLGSPSGEGLDFINGFAFLERFYHVFDSENGQAGFAATRFTHATTN